MLSLPPLVTMPVIQFSVCGFAFFNTFIITVNTWWNCLSLSWCSGSTVRWLCPHFFSNQFLFCYAISQVTNIFTLIPISISPLPNSAQGLLQQFSCQPTQAIQQIAKKIKLKVSYLIIAPIAAVADETQCRAHSRRYMSQGCNEQCKSSGVSWYTV